MLTLLLVIVAYLIGSISFAVVASRAMGLPDPHSYGSRNPGATNVLRSGNKAAALLTLVGDALKGAVALWLARWVAAEAFDPAATAAVALAAFVGHLYPVYFRFRGGKGVATGGGILFALDWRLGTGAAAIWLLVALATRYSSLAAVASALGASAIAWYFLGEGYVTVAVLAIALLLLMRHAGNIRRLIDGTESRIKLLR
jgi:glycerol-3-phosphate acyltransferase PlsY